ncbi:hypothetical protein DTO027B9_2381 [Paecilomyces variotii]|nr:hypothetical protein DTO027B9_2381 [Paecilomyces variotii]
MDPAGLTLSIVGLAGFVSTIIDLLNYVSDAGNRDEDYKTIQDLFELERGRFMQWVQVYNNYRRPKKEAKMIRALQADPSVKTIFTRMERLIADGASIMEQYSLNRLDLSGDKRSKGTGRMLPMTYGRLGRRTNTLPHRIRWVVRDREKFRALINDMTLLNDRFESLSKMRYKLEHRKPIHEEISSCSDQYISESISVVYQRNDTHSATQRCSTVEDETGSSPFHDGPTDGDNGATISPYMAIYNEEGLEGIGSFLSTVNPSLISSDYTNEYIDTYLVDTLELNPFLSSGRHETSRELWIGCGNLISHIRKEDTKHCEAILANLRPYRQSIGLERRMRLELRFLLNFSSINPLDVNRGCTMAPIGDNIYEWRAVVEGPVNSPYEGGIFYIRIKIPRTYPMEPPQWKFETAIYHPNISKTSGEAVPGLLDLITQNRPWCADQTLLLWIVSIWKLLKKPSQDPMHVVEKDILLQLKSDRISFDRTARQWTSMYASLTAEYLFSNPKYNIEQKSDEVMRLENFLLQTAEASSQLEEYITDAGLSALPERTSAYSVSGMLKEVHHIRNSRFIDVLGGEEFARHAAARLCPLSTRTDLVHVLLAELKRGSQPIKRLLTRASQDLSRLMKEFLEWRLQIEEDLATKAYRDCLYFEEDAAFVGAGFQNCKEQISPSADLPFLLDE